MNRGEWDHMLELMPLQKSAWYNFKVALELLQDPQEQKELECYLAEKNQTVQHLIASLHSKVESYKDQLLEKKVRISKERKRLMKFLNPSEKKTIQIEHSI